MISYESLFQPIEKPAGVDDLRPVLPATHDALVAKLRGLAVNLQFMADVIKALPWADGLADELGTGIDRRIAEANDALVIFRATRDCGGIS